jgi:hypothetical protein
LARFFWTHACHQIDTRRGDFADQRFHDFFLGPRAAAAWEADPASAETFRLRRQAVQLGRLNLLLALVVIVLGVMLVRGAP